MTWILVEFKEFIVVFCDTCISEQFITVPLSLAVTLSAKIFEISGRVDIPSEVFVILNVVAFIIIGAAARAVPRDGSSRMLVI